MQNKYLKQHSQTNPIQKQTFALDLSIEASQYIRKEKVKQKFSL